VFRKNLIVLGFRLLFTPPLFPVDIRGAARPGQNSLPLGDHTEVGDLKFPAPECLLMVQVYLAPGQNAGGPCCTTEVCNTHKTSLREVKYRWHPWHGKTVLVRGEACRAGRVVLQCVLDELNGFPSLEIPEWMFDSRVCSRMYSALFPHVDCGSLLALKQLISAATGSSELNVVQAHHPGKSGDADAQNVSGQNPSRQIVFSTREASGVTSRSTTEDGPTAGQDAERILAAPPFLRRETGAER
jgi:hypothetical protein